MYPSRSQKISFGSIPRLLNALERPLALAGTLFMVEGCTGVAATFLILAFACLLPAAFDLARREVWSTERSHRTK
jgi:hypothetical protein